MNEDGWLRRCQEFDRWLVRELAKARAIGHREGYETAREDVASGAFIGGPTYEALRDSYTGRRIVIEALCAAADEIDVGYNSHTLNLERRQIKRWLRARAAGLEAALGGAS